MRSGDFLPRTGPVLAEAVNPAIPGNMYTVQAGDTLKNLAKAADTTVSGLLFMNPDISDTGQPAVGSKIKLPNLGQFARGQATGAAPALSANAATALKFFTQQGWSAAQAAGIVGNLQAESGKNINPATLGDGGKGYGISQWQGSRQKDFERVMGIPLKGSGLEDQLKFIQWELTNPKSAERRAGDRLKAATTAAEAAEIIDKFYERSSGIHLDRRKANAVALANTTTMS